MQGKKNQILSLNQYLVMHSSHPGKCLKTGNSRIRIFGIERLAINFVVNVQVFLFVLHVCVLCVCKLYMCVSTFVCRCVHIYVEA